MKLSTKKDLSVLLKDNLGKKHVNDNTGGANQNCDKLWLLHLVRIRILVVVLLATSLDNPPTCRHYTDFTESFEKAYQEDLEDLIGVRENDELHSLTRRDIDVAERIDANLLLHESSTTPTKEIDDTFIDDDDIDQSSSTEDENSKDVESDDDIDSN
ncbi:hypothetical protein ACH5RR_015382 [Cinchona calisaya]|uniref:Uncharacterized protein n=1 Tax=Cinchona calisaya TaxID=153742 RepID=A0ABD2ZU82_9GENT